MKRLELPLYRELEKKEKTILKSVARQYGWRLSSYIGWKIESGYFICLRIAILGYVLSEISLRIKPLFIDDLWWDVFDMPSNKNEPKSLRGLGAFAVSAPLIEKYSVLDRNHALDYSPEEIESTLNDVFQRIDKDIQTFLAKHPNPDNFCPEDGGEYGRICPIYTLTMDLHAGKYTQVEERIKDYRSRGVSSGFCKSSSTKGEKDAYDYFLDWCHNH